SPGFMLWTNATHGYQEASMGYSGNDIGWANFQSHSFQDRYAVAYAESHDEERLMYKNLQFGNSNGDYDTSDETIALRRQQLTMAFNLLMPGPRMIWQFEELGYDYSINTCSDGVTVSPDCRVAAKPVRWDYYSQPERKHLYDVSGAFAALKRDYPAFGPDATWFNLDVGSYGKRMRFEHSAGDAVVVGNYKTTGIDMVPGFTHTGTWHDFISGESINVTDLDAAMPFAPGELHVYTDTPLDTPVLQEIDVDLDGQLASEGDCNDQDATVYTGAVDIALDGIDQDCDGEDALTSVPEHASSWSLYPNPATDVLTLQHSRSDLLTSVHLLDATGRRMDVPAAWSVGTVTLDLSGVADGVYHLTWREAGRVFSTPVHKMNR
ncbi:MAG: hypothetical protein CL835_04150, partial [Crocinitomicaceae bacterium]|nr:hypothetical protein [Crocinitomicaceae bacterium]